MTYTEQQKQALSRKVAEKLNLTKFLPHGFIDGADVGGWLHDDWHTIMELCVKHGVDVEHKTTTESWVEIKYAKAKTRSGQWFIARYDFHGDSPSLAERVARLLALGEVKI